MTGDRPADDDAPPEVVILLALMNGAAYLDDQLASFCAQTHPHWSLITSDDGSTDAGPDIIRRFAEAQRERHRVVLNDGPRQGFAQNFLHLLRLAGPDAPNVALSDQDDVWQPEKLARGIAALRKVPPGTPALFCTNWMICNADLTRRKLRTPLRRPLGFGNALIQNVASGHSIMLNRAAITLLQRASHECGSLAAHDWWIYQMITGAGGVAIYDPAPMVLYRQHATNAIGSNHTARAVFLRLRMIAMGRYRDWNDANIAALRASSHHLTGSNRDLLSLFARARGAGIAARLMGLRRCGVYRQERIGTVGFWLAVLMGRA